MQLTLRLHSTAQRPACAAFLRGTDAGAWLRELSRWQLPAEQLSCYLVPESIRSMRVAGLLVVARAGATLPADVLEPYGVEAERLYLPTHAALWPATTPAELAQALLWPRQLWHPAVGLVGFETTDELDLLALLDCPAPQPTDWSRAVPGPAPKAALRHLRVEAPSVEQVLQDMRQDVGTTPLTELPRPAGTEPTPARQLLTKLRRSLLSAGLAVVQWLQRWFGGSGRRLPLPGLGNTIAFLGALALGVLLLFWLASSMPADFHFPWGTFAPALIFLAIRLAGLFGKHLSGAGGQYAPVRPTRPAGPGLLERLGNRLSGNLNDLERKRHDEIERLLRLFSDNPAEALKYAIPLGGPYQSRGNAPASATLGPRDTTFNLGGLGGGRSVDGWDLGQYQYHLRRKYEAAAEAETQAGRYPKAAYIYAHLLADFAAAAKVLEQGGLFREAAALHREHLHNPAAAAQCLERGGLLLEAATLYAELQRHEQAGDVYQQLAQPQLAARHYERATEQQLSNQDHLDAARLLHDKLRDSARAQQVLLTGWAEPKQSEACLRRYFELAADAPEADLPARVREVYQQHTPTSRRLPLLQVLAQLTTARPTDETLLDTSRELAYEVAGSEAAAGNVAPLGLLRHFLPTDRLLQADVSRFTSRRQRRLTDSLPTVQAPQLDASIHWLHAVAHGAQWVAVGRRDQRLHLARGNWYGNVEYYSWLAPVPAELSAVLVADAQHSTRIILRPEEPLTFEPKLLPRNKYFSAALQVECPAYLPPWPTRVAVLPDDGLATAHLSVKHPVPDVYEGPGPSIFEVLVQRYAADGALLPPLLYGLDMFDAYDEPERTWWPAELVYHHGNFYSYWTNQLVTLSTTAPPEQTGYHVHRQFEAPDASETWQLARCAYAAEPRLAALTNAPAGLVLWRPEHPTGSAPQVQPGTPSNTPVDLQFVGADYLVAAFNDETHLYHLSGNDARLARTIRLEDPAAILPVDRTQFAVLLRSGALTLHALAPAD